MNKGLLAVKKACKAGNRVVFDESGSYIEDKCSREKTWFEEKDGIYTLSLWVRRDGKPMQSSFVRQEA